MFSEKGVFMFARLKSIVSIGAAIKFVVSLGKNIAKIRTVVKEIKDTIRAGRMIMLHVKKARSDGKYDSKEIDKTFELFDTLLKELGDLMNLMFG